ncbi:hypothetical protein F5887DRAFT_917101 [Amanita rubescens]|nr:hypothetical protein F5887DRAFT_917101 [Amanita rubescens]
MLKIKLDLCWPDMKPNKARLNDFSACVYPYLTPTYFHYIINSASNAIDKMGIECGPDAERRIIYDGFAHRATGIGGEVLPHATHSFASLDRKSVRFAVPLLLH